MVYQTPLLKHEFGHQSKSPTIYVKYESLQPSRSFKFRGISHFIERAISSKPILVDTMKVYSSSGGNAGLAAATAAKSFGMECIVVVPKTTKLRMIQKIEKEGATVLVHGENWGHADTYLRETIMKEAKLKGLTPLYVHPFDNELIWEGHSSIVDEVLLQLKQENIPSENLAGIVCSVGGGGLFSGIVKGLERHGLAESVPIIAVETEGSDVMAKSLRAGERVELNKISTVASSLGSPYLAEFAYQSARKYGSKSVVLSDWEVVSTTLKFADEFNIITEPACGASLHLGYYPDIVATSLERNLTPKDIIVVIACGGSCMSYEELLSFKPAGMV
ncbi:LAMI_0A00452g1_1 [Lachancea mirantina]|uniref:L-serine ammonia-lyase n=1 Tax=Lachancea mirantina TaxID=1230905 RepID=A0A1G4IL39_9SACH|nr:LAMI_0A00452g1_1 [Lachancea mirantina]